MNRYNYQLINSSQHHGSDKVVAKGLDLPNIGFAAAFPNVKRSQLPRSIFKMGTTYYIAEKEAQIGALAESLNLSYKRAKVTDVLSSRGLSPATLQKMLVDCRNNDYDYKESRRSTFSRNVDILEKVQALGAKLPESKKFARSLIENEQNFFRWNPEKQNLRSSISIIHSPYKDFAATLSSPFSAQLALYLRMLQRFPQTGLTVAKFLTIVAFESNAIINQSLLEYGALLGKPKFHKSLTGKPLNYGISVSSTQVLMNTAMVNQMQTIAGRCGIKISAMPDSRDYNDAAKASFLGVANTFNYITSYAMKFPTRNLWGIYAGLGKADMLSTPQASNPLFLVKPIAKYKGQKTAFLSAGVLKNDRTYNQVRNTYDRSVFERCLDFIFNQPEIKD